jgi:hypothetical protein
MAVLSWNFALFLFYRIPKNRKQVDGNFIPRGLNELRDGGLTRFVGEAVKRNLRHDTS